MAMIKHMITPYDREQFLNMSATAALYTYLHHVGDYIKQAMNDNSSIYLRKALLEHRKLMKYVSELKIELREPHPKRDNIREPNVIFPGDKNKKLPSIDIGKEDEFKKGGNKVGTFSAMGKEKPL